MFRLLLLELLFLAPLKFLVDNLCFFVFSFERLTESCSGRRRSSEGGGNIICRTDGRHDQLDCLRSSPNLISSTPIYKLLTHTASATNCSIPLKTTYKNNLHHDIQTFSGRKINKAPMI